VKSLVRSAAFPTALLFLLVSACATGSTKSAQRLRAEAAPTLAAESEAWPDWSHPLGPDSMLPEDPEAAKASLSFSVTEPPQEWGTSEFFVTDPESAGGGDYAAWMYRDDDGAPLYVLIEARTEKTDGTIKQLATCQPDESGCQQQNFAAAQLGDGTPALVVVNATSRVLNWVEGEAEFILAGPIDTFTTDEAIQKADDLSAPK
jgi:hypothetical protein